MAKDKDGKVIDLHKKKVEKVDRDIQKEDPEYVVALRMGEQGIAQALDQHVESFDLVAMCFGGIEMVVNPTQILQAGEPDAMPVPKFVLIFKKKQEPLIPLKRV